MISLHQLEVKGEEIVPIALNGFSSWQPFVCRVCAWKKLPTFEKLALQSLENLGSRK
jgi:hypothetical protein